MSVNPSARSSSSQTYWGAKQIAGILASRTVVVSIAGAAARARNGGKTPAAPATAVMVRKRRRVWMIGIANLPRYYPRLQRSFLVAEYTPIYAVPADSRERTSLCRARSAPPQPRGQDVASWLERARQRRAI